MPLSRLLLVAALVVVVAVALVALGLGLGSAAWASPACRGRTASKHSVRAIVRIPRSSSVSGHNGETRRTIAKAPKGSHLRCVRRSHPAWVARHLGHIISVSTG